GLCPFDHIQNIASAKTGLEHRTFRRYGQFVSPVLVGEKQVSACRHALHSIIICNPDLAPNRVITAKIRVRAVLSIDKEHRVLPEVDCLANFRPVCEILHLMPLLSVAQRLPSPSGSGNQIFFPGIYSPWPSRNPDWRTPHCE